MAHSSDLGKEIGRRWDALSEPDKAAWASGVPPTQPLFPTPPSPNPPNFSAPDLIFLRGHGFVSILDDIKSIMARKGKLGFLEQDIDRLQSSVSGLSDNERIDHLAEDCPERSVFLDFKCYYDDGHDELTYALSGGYWGGGYIAMWRQPSREMVLKATVLLLSTISGSFLAATRNPGTTLLTALSD